MSAHDEAVVAADARLHPGDWRRAANDQKQRPAMVAFIIRAYLAHMAAAGSAHAIALLAEIDAPSPEKAP